VQAVAFGRWPARSGAWPSLRFAESVGLAAMWLVGLFVLASVLLGLLSP
jgi:hypothetical protein